MLSWFEIIQSINTDPKKYLGYPSLQRLFSYLNGYWYAHPNCSRECLDGFNAYIAKQYNINSSHNWPSIIDFFSSDEKDAYNNFICHFNNFTQNKNICDTPQIKSGTEQSVRPLLDIIIEVSYFPEIVLGNPSLERLEAFLRGCGHGEVNYDTRYIDGFNQYIKDRYSIATNKSWAEIISFFSYDDRGAYDNFINNFNDYLSQTAGSFARRITKRSPGERGTILRQPWGERS